MSPSVPPNPRLPEPLVHHVEAQGNALSSSSEPPELGQPLPGTTGWTSTFAGVPAILLNPQVQLRIANSGARTNRFWFDITGGSNQVIVVEASTNLVNPLWSPVGTNTLAAGSSYFSDPRWTNFARRFYRVRSP